MTLDKILEENAKFVRIADAQISDADFHTYMRVKEQMMMQDILMNEDAFVKDWVEKHQGSLNAAKTVLKGVMYQDVLESYHKLVNTEYDVFNDVLQAFENVLNDQNLTSSEK